jgi:hypothetical protein
VKVRTGLKVKDSINYIFLPVIDIIIAVEMDRIS